MFTISGAQAQPYPKHTPPLDNTKPPSAFDAKRWPILARHWFGIAPLFVPVTQERNAARTTAEAA